MERANRLTKRDYNKVFSFTDASKFQIDNDATNTKGKSSSSTINDDYNLNRTVVDDDDDDDMTMNGERKSNVIINQRRELIRLFKLIVIVTGCLESDCLFL